MTREQADAEAGGYGKRAEMRDEQPLEPTTGREEQPREDPPQTLFPTDEQADRGPEHHARPHPRGRDLADGPPRHRPDQTPHRARDQRPLVGAAGGPRGG